MPYTALAAFAAAVIRRHARPETTTPEARPNLRRDLGRGAWRHCAGCGKPCARGKQIRIMEEALARTGLPATHLDLCPDCRNRTQGFFGRHVA